MTVFAAAGVCGAAGSRSDQPGWVAFDGDRITETGVGRPPSGAADLGNAVLAPGFIDLQVNGVGAIDFAAATALDYADALSALAAQGVTGCCPTICSAPLDAYGAVLARAEGALLVPGAERRPTLLGVHLEGPFLGGAPGAHPTALLRAADPAWLQDLLDRYEGLVRVVTIAPEADPTGEATRLLASRGVVVAIGHSAASYEDAIAMVDMGASVATHCYNGMGAFHHRAPGVVGAALDEPRLTPTLIADLVHVHPAALRLAAGAKRNVALVTDAIAVAAGSITGLTVHVENGAPRLANGTLAGTSLTMDAALRNMVAIGVELDRVVEMAATIPAEVLGLRDRGRLEPGTRADIVVLDRATLAVRSTWLAGHPAFVA